MDFFFLFLFVCEYKNILFLHLHAAAVAGRHSKSRRVGADGILSLITHYITIIVITVNRIVSRGVSDQYAWCTTHRGKLNGAKIRWKNIL